LVITKIDYRLFWQLISGEGFRYNTEREGGILKLHLKITPSIW